MSRKIMNNDFSITIVETVFIDFMITIETWNNVK